MSGGAPDDTVTLLAGGRQLTGWQTVRVTRGIERMPSDFDIEMTERYPGELAEIVVKPGDPCQIQLGADLVLSGYVDRYSPFIGPQGHGVRLQGRGKCADLVDCSAIIDSMQITTGSLVDLASRLAAPYGIIVRSATGDNVPLTVPGSSNPVQFNVTPGETVFEVVELVARYATVLAYEDTDGALLLAGIGLGAMGSGFGQGVNVQAATATFSMDARFSSYQPTYMSVYAIAGYGPGVVQPFAPVLDQGVPRFRQRLVVSEQWQYSEAIAVKRAQWEMARRFGRSQAVQLVCDSWRDTAGRLWTPNFTAALDLPALKIADQVWVIGDVTFLRDADRGTVAELTLMPPDAFRIAPSILQLYHWDIGQALNGTGGADGAAPGTPAPPPRPQGGAR